MKVRPSAQSTPVATTCTVSVKGKKQEVPAWQVGEHLVVLQPGAIRIAELFDAYWLEAKTLPPFDRLVETMAAAANPPDVVAFTQRAPDTTPHYDFYHEWENVAAIPISTHDEWLRKQVSPASRRNIRTSEKRGVVVRSCPYDEVYVRGIMAICNESPIRAGRKYWHYGKEFEVIEAENGTYRDRSTFLGAFVDGEMVGYLKLVWDAQTAAIMQIVSRVSHRDRRPNNALLSEAVRLCAERGVGHLLYERFVYGNNVDSSLTRFKRENGFARMDLPSYYVPLTWRGRVALKLGLHHPLKDRLPLTVASALRDARDRWNSRHVAAV